MRPNGQPRIKRYPDKGRKVFWCLKCDRPSGASKHDREDYCFKCLKKISFN